MCFEQGNYWHHWNILQVQKLKYHTNWHRWWAFWASKIDPVLRRCHINHILCSIPFATGRSSWKLPWFCYWTKQICLKIILADYRWTSVSPSIRVNLTMKRPQTTYDSNSWISKTDRASKLSAVLRRCHGNYVLCWPLRLLSSYREKEKH